MTKATSLSIRSVWVLGGTSTVAIAICHRLASQGCLRFHLLARNKDRNQALAIELRDLYGQVSCETFDLLAGASQPHLSEFLTFI